MKFVNLFLIIALFVGSIWFYPALPAQIPTHWNLQGNIDSYQPKQYAVWFIPVLATVIWGLFQVLPKLDPNKHKYVQFEKEWRIIQTGMLLFFTYLHFVIFYLAINPGVKMMPLMFIGFGSLLILLGNYMSKIRQNYFIGIKLPWTLASEENWNKTHRFASWCYVIAGIITLIQAVSPWQMPILVFASILFATLLPSLYSFLFFKNATSKMNYVYFALGFIAVVLILLRVAAGEDGWICQDGEWVQHGQPTTSQPEESCP